MKALSALLFYAALLALVAGSPAPASKYASNFLSTSVPLGSLQDFSALGDASKAGHSGRIPGSDLFVVRDRKTNESCMIFSFGDIQIRTVGYGLNTSFLYPPINTDTCDISVSFASFWVGTTVCPYLNTQVQPPILQASVLFEIPFANMPNWTCYGYRFNECPFDHIGWQRSSGMTLLFEFQGTPSLENPLVATSWEVTYIYRDLVFAFCDQYSCPSRGPSGPIAANYGAGSYASSDGYGMSCNTTITYSLDLPSYEGEYEDVTDLSYFGMQPFNLKPNASSLEPAPGKELGGCVTCQGDTSSTPSTTLLIAVAIAVGCAVMVGVAVGIFLYRRRKFVDYTRIN